MTQSPSALPTKLGQPSTSSPGTLESNRRRLGSVFSFLSSGPSDSSSGTDRNLSTPTRPSRLRSSQTAADLNEGGWLSWLTPTKYLPRAGEGTDLSAGNETDEDGRGRLGSSSQRTATSSSGDQTCHLLNLPEELLIDILMRLPPNQIRDLSSVSRRFHSLSQSPVIWSYLIDSTPGFQILPEYRDRIVACEHAPPGHWNGHHFISSLDQALTPMKCAPTPTAPRIYHSLASFWTPTKGRRDNSIQVHYPTLYRSRLALSHLIRPSNHDPQTPPSRTKLKEHTDSVYCLHVTTPWLITGSRDRSIRIWRLADLPVLPAASTMEEEKQARCLKVVENAHEGSVLAVRFELDPNGRSGILLTGSSDLTAGVWSVQLGDKITVKRKGILRGHEAGVLDVALGKTRLATCSKDASIRIYDKSTFAHLFTLNSHTAPVNCLALDPSFSPEKEQVVSASGDAQWIVWDMLTGEEVRRGGGDGRGLACIAWQGDYILTGDNDRLVKLFDANSTELLRTYAGHTDLVRTISLDLSTRTIISGSYDKSVKLWDLDSNDLIQTIRNGHVSLVFGVAMERGRIISVSHDKSVQILTFGHDLPYRGLFA